MREVVVLVEHAGLHLGSLSFEVPSSPWWNDVEPVTAHLDAVLGVTSAVLRLVSVAGGGRTRDGRVTYLVEVDRVPTRGLLLRSPDPELPEDPLRLPWACPGGPRALLDWADGLVTRTGPAVQVKTWNLSCVYRLPTASGPVWLKATPPFLADEAAVVALVAGVAPDLAPRVLASEPGRTLSADAGGHDCWETTSADLRAVLPRFTAAQVALAGSPDLAALRRRDVGIGSHGLPETLLHGDFHCGNWRSSGVVLDWSDAHRGNPALDAARMLGSLPVGLRGIAERVWVEGWREAFPGSDPVAALGEARSAVHLLAAEVYAGFLAGIERSERVYHEGDVERALADARAAAGAVARAAAGGAGQAAGAPES
ncbi:phosphotransferase [Actinosynnema pretiosum subsp. pretiosum]|uniref:Phosphotransferase n=1 Tax=Actinosynnema pretiosum subsp. pretiosum TaxID=103721 RepID=A0AA45L3N0_9PSEU|nr:hypothetical protein APASM_6042 [Actinosynnema pretiosum subsp. pretiosum]QUF02781.1 phosphotransferase [Actinosynnema pretiosum subsp. pretiosum]